MWKQLLEFGKQLFSLTRETQQNKTDLAALRQELKEMREELKRLAEVVQQLKFDQQRDRENEAHEREKLLLRLEVWRLQFERQLPPGEDESRPNEERT
jgi:hypothetical protein